MSEISLGQGLVRLLYEGEFKIGQANNIYLVEGPSKD